MTALNIYNSTISSEIDLRPNTEPISPNYKNVRQFTKPKFRKHPILSPMNSDDNSARDYDSDSDMPGLHEQAREDESSDNDNDKK